MSINPLNLPEVTAALLEETQQAKIANASWFLKIFDYCRTDLSTPFSDFPYLWNIKKSQIKAYSQATIKETDRTEFGTQKNVPSYVLSIPLHDPSIEKVTKIVQMIEQQSFGHTKEESETQASKQIAVVIGLNTFGSLDKEHNSNFIQKIETLRAHSAAKNISKSISLTIFPFLWWHGWALKKEFATRLTFLADKCYLIAKSYFNHLTKSTGPLWISEGFSKNHRPVTNTIPYQFIRNTILHSQDLKRYMECSQSEARYVLSLDSDFSSLKAPNALGLLSHYDNLIRNHKHLNALYPDIVSTGYEQSSETTNVMIQAGIKLDRYIRAAMPAKLIYMPEPNFAFRIKNITELLSLTWVGGGADNMTTEARRLIDSGISKGIFNPDHFVFSLSSPIQTEIDAEWYTLTVKKFASLTKKDLTQKGVQKALRGIHQSHADPQIWATNVYTGLGRTLSSYMKDGIAPIKGIHELFDPVSVKNGKYPKVVKNDLWCILAIYDQYAEIMRQVITLETTKDAAISHFLNQQPNFSKTEWKFFFENQINCLQDYTKILLESYTPEETGFVISTAISTGKAIVDFYREEMLPPD